MRKITSLRLWWVLLLVPIAMGVGISAMVSAVAPATETFSPGMPFLVSQLGIYVSLLIVLLFVAVFAAVNASTEYRHKTITTSFLSSRRDGVIAAKLAVTTGFGLLYGAAIEASTVLATMAFSDNFEFNDSLRKVLASGLVVVALWSLMGSGVGFILRSPVAAALTLPVWFIVGELVVGLILTFGQHDAFGYISSSLPGKSTYAAVAAGQFNPDSATGYEGFWPAIIRVIVWAIIAVGLGWYLARKRDVT